MRKVKLNIGILSRGSGLYSTQSLFQAGMRQGHHMQVIDHMNCSVFIDRDKPRVFYGNYSLQQLDAIIPRIGASVTQHGAAVVRQLEVMNVISATSSEALLRARDKLRSLQYLAQQSVPVPRTIFVNQTMDLPPLIQRMGGLPVVIKLLESTHGVGVVLAETEQMAVSLVEMFVRTREKVLVQEFIKEASGIDVRAFVVGKRIVAAMERRAVPGEFRSNLHRGATAITTRLSKEEKRIVLKAAETMGLEIAGVDLLRSKRGPLVIEVNASPGLEGIETTTGEDIAGAIIELLEDKVLRETQSGFLR